MTRTRRRWWKLYSTYVLGMFKVRLDGVPAVGAAAGRRRATRRRSGAAPAVRAWIDRPEGRLWQDLMLFWQEKSAPSVRRGASADFRRGRDYKTRRSGWGDNDKYSSNPATHSLPRCVQRGPDAIWP